MPLVVMLMMVAGVMAAVFLERAAADRLSIQRQLDGYKVHHTAAGVREVLSAWLTPLRGQAIAEKLDPNTGKALDLELPDGGVITVYFGDGQGSALADLTTVGADAAADGQAVLDELAAIGNGSVPEGLVRRVGPVKVSLVTAPEQVILAVARAIAREDGGGVRPESFVSEVVKARESEDGLSEAALNTAAAAANFQASHKVKMNRLVTISPTLWTIGVEVTAPKGHAGVQTLTHLYMAGVNLEDGASKAAMGIDPLGPFLFWEELPIE